MSKTMQNIGTSNNLNGKRKGRGLILAAAALAVGSLLAANPAQAATYTWAGGAGANWDQSDTNWTPFVGTNLWNIAGAGAHSALFNTAGDLASINAVDVNFLNLNFAANSTVNSNAGGKIINNGNKIWVTTNPGVTAAINSNMLWTGNFDQVEGIKFDGGGNLTINGQWTSLDGNQKNVITVNGGTTLTVATGALISNRYTGGNAQPNFTWIGRVSSGNTVIVDGRWLTHTLSVGDSTFGSNSLVVNGPGTDATPTVQPPATTSTT